MTTGSDLLAQALVDVGVKDYFFILGGPLGDAHRRMVELGIRPIDVRHEQAAAMMAHAYARVTGNVGLAMGCSGPGALNLTTGIATAWADGAPVVAIGGSSPSFQDGMGTFQEVDQVACFRPITKWSTRINDPARIPDTIEEAFQRARGGRPGPVYVDLPANVLYGSTREKSADDGKGGAKSFEVPVRAAQPPEVHRALADPDSVRRAVQVLAAAERPVIVVGTGALWSEAWDELRAFVDYAGIPFYSTPQARGLIEEDHALSLLGARSAAWRGADVVVVIGTRLNHMVGFGRPPRFAADAQFIQLDIDQEQLGHNRSVDVALLGDAKAVLRQLCDEAQGTIRRESYAPWVDRLTAMHHEKSAQAEERAGTDQTPIHPLRLAKEVRDAIGRDTILVVDGQEILVYCRQTIPSYLPRHRLNSGPFGTMGVGLPFAIGAKVAAPDKQVVVVHGDGSFGMNGMEIDTAVRHGVPIVCVIANNGGWTAIRPGPHRPGRDLGFVRYDLMAEGLGAYGELVERPEDIRPALDRAMASGRPAVVNVIVDAHAKSEQARFSVHEVD